MEQTDEIKNLSVAQLKKELTARGVDFSDCIEKSELVSRLASARLSSPQLPTPQVFRTFYPPLPSPKPNYIQIKDLSTLVKKRAHSRGGDFVNEIMKFFTNLLVKIQLVSKNAKLISRFVSLLLQH
jgi:hypothetical protein